MTVCYVEEFLRVSIITRIDIGGFTNVRMMVLPRTGQRNVATRLDHNHALSSTKSKYFPAHKYTDINTRKLLLND